MASIRYRPGIATASFASRSASSSTSSSEGRHSHRVRLPAVVAVNASRASRIIVMVSACWLSCAANRCGPSPLRYSRFTCSSVNAGEWSCPRASGAGGMTVSVVNSALSVPSGLAR